MPLCSNLPRSACRFVRCHEPQVWNTGECPSPVFGKCRGEMSLRRLTQQPLQEEKGILRLIIYCWLILTRGRISNRGEPNHWIRTFRHMVSKAGPFRGGMEPFFNSEKAAIRGASVSLSHNDSLINNLILVSFDFSRCNSTFVLSNGDVNPRPRHYKNLCLSVRTNKRGKIVWKS